MLVNVFSAVQLFAYIVIIVLGMKCYFISLLSLSTSFPQQRIDFMESSEQTSYDEIGAFPNTLFYGLCDGMFYFQFNVKMKGADDGHVQHSIHQVFEPYGMFCGVDDPLITHNSECMLLIIW